MKTIIRITVRIALIAFLTQCANTVPAAAAQSDPVLRVDADGKIFLNDGRVTARVGNSPPVAFEKLQGSPANADQEADRGTWYSYTKVGVLVFAKAGKGNDFFSIVLPSSVSQDFPQIVFTGTFVLGNVQFPFKKGHVLQRNEVLELLKGLSGMQLIKRENDFSIYLGSTSIDIEFDSSNTLRDVVVGIKAEDATR